MKPQKFYSNGKLLLTGEYLVLDGALALAVPTKFGQSLTIAPMPNQGELQWESYDIHGKIWFEAQMTDHLASIKANDPKIGDRLLNIFKTIKKECPDFLCDTSGLHIKTRLDFPRDWGLGTSSTLINNLAQWAQIDPYVLLEATFGGSGYDIACATHNRPITYQLEKGNRTIIERPFDPDFKTHLYFVHLNQKQDSREGIFSYQKQDTVSPGIFSEINAITNDMLSCTSLDTFQFLMQSHERIIAKIIQQHPVKNRLFKDFEGSIKSLGAWGGDFVLVATEENPTSYFENKGYATIIGYEDMVL